MASSPVALIPALHDHAQWRWSLPTVMGVIGAVFRRPGPGAAGTPQLSMPGWHAAGRRRWAGRAAKRGRPARTGEEVGLSGGEASSVRALCRVRRLGDAMSWRCTASPAGRMNFRPSLEIRDICFADPCRRPPGCTAATLRRLGRTERRCRSRLTLVGLPFRRRMPLAKSLMNAARSRSWQIRLEDQRMRPARGALNADSFRPRPLGQIRLSACAKACAPVASELSFRRHRRRPGPR